MTPLQRPMVIDPTKSSPGPPPERPLPLPPIMRSSQSSRTEESLDDQEMEPPVVESRAFKERAPSALLPESPRGLIGLPQRPGPMIHNNLASTVHLPPLAQQSGFSRRREPGRFDTTLRGSSSRLPTAVNENVRSSNEASTIIQTSEGLSPRRLNDPLQRLDRNYEDLSEGHSSLNSELSSITPSEAEMMGITNTRTDLNLQQGSLQFPSPIHRTDRFSNVPTIFDVSPSRLQPIAPISKEHSIPTAEIKQVTTETDPFFEVPGSRSTGTRPDLPSTSESQSLQLLGAAPVFSLTAGAATAADVISGNRTLEKSSVGSEETAPRKRHYEGCMLCSPLPSPSSSQSSYLQDRLQLSTSDQVGSGPRGPPPNDPLPDITHPVADNQPRLQQYEGEMIVNTLPPAGRGAYYQPSKPFQTELAPEYTKPAQISPVPTTMVHASGPGPSSYLELSSRVGKHPAYEGTLRRNIENVPAENSAAYSFRMTGDIANFNTAPTISQDPENISQHSLLRARSSRTSKHIRLQVRQLGTNSRKLLVRASNQFSGIRASRKLPWSPNARPGAPSRQGSAIELRDTTLRDPGRSTLSTDNAHPGVRLDHFGNDGTFQPVDLSEPTATPSNRFSAKNEPLGRRLNSWFFRSWTKFLIFHSNGQTFKWVLIVFGLIAVILMIVLPLLYVAFPSIAQRTVDKAKIDISSISITDVQPDSVNVRMDLSLSPESSSKSLVGSTNLRLSLKAPSLQDSSATQKRSTELRQEAVGKLALINPSDKGMVEPVLVGFDNGRFSIQNAATWGYVVESLVHSREGIIAQLEGSVKVATGGLKSECALNKSVQLPGIGGVKVKVVGYSMMNQGAQTFATKFELQSNASDTFDLGDVNFDFVYGTKRVGGATVNGLVIRPGSNQITAYGALGDDTATNKSNFLGAFLSSLFVGADKSSAWFALKGVNATVQGQEIEWLQSTARRLEFPLLSVQNGTDENHIEKFELMALLSASDPEAQANGSISHNFNIPAGLEGLGLVSTGIAYNLTIATSTGVQVAELVLDIAPPSGTTDIVRPFSNERLVILNQTNWTEFFIKPLLANDSVAMAIGGNMTAFVETNLGNATITPIPLEDLKWNIKGYGLAKRTVTGSLENLVFLDVQADQIRLNVEVKLNLTAELPIKIGAVQFMAAIGKSKQIIGSLEIDDFTLSNGSRTYEGRISVSHQNHTRQAVFNSFLTSMFSGKTVPLTLTAPNLTVILPIGTNIKATLTSPGYDNFVQGFKLNLAQTQDLLNPQALETIVQFFNPLPIPIQIYAIEVTFGFNETVGNANGQFPPMSIDPITIEPSEVLSLEGLQVEGVSPTAVAQAYQQRKQTPVQLRVAIGLGDVAGVVDLNLLREITITDIKAMD